MARNWAICVGVNEYDNLPNLKFAKRDAEQMQQYFKSDVKFDKIYLFTDDSPPIDDADKPYASRPTYGALRRFLRIRFEDSFLSDGDNLWFFFSGHGIRHQDRDYLLPSDADPDPAGIEDTAISISYVSERLRRSGADNVILVLDACRNEQSSKDVGIGYEKQQGVITFSSCSPAERSYEVEALEQGSFTYALLESLRIQGEGNCATVERLSRQLKYRVKEINQCYEKPKQTPQARLEPESKYHLILLPNAATAQDIIQLKFDASSAENKQQWDLAKQLWMRVNVAARGTDMDAIEAIQRFPTFRTIANSVEPLIQQEIVSKNANQHAGLDGYSQYKAEKALDSFITNISQQKNTILLPNQQKPTTRQIAVLRKSVLAHKKTPDITISQRYEQLESYLKAQKFQDANKETDRVMLEVVEKKSNEWLSMDDIKSFPCEDLKIINDLWKKYSNGKFGFSVQKQIWLNCGGIPGVYDYDKYEKFARTVNWFMKDRKWYGDINYTAGAVEGHLPSTIISSTGSTVLSLFSRGDL